MDMLEADDDVIFTTVATVPNKDDDNIDWAWISEYILNLLLTRMPKVQQHNSSAKLMTILKNFRQLNRLLNSLQPNF